MPNKFSFFRPGSGDPTETKQAKITPEQEAFVSELQYFEENEDSYLNVCDLQKKMN